MVKVFISYSSNDEEKVKRLNEQLKAASDIKTWVDFEQILPGDDLFEKINKGIQSSDKFIICLSPSFNSRPPHSWVREELKMALLKERKRGKLIVIPVRIKKGGNIPIELGSKAYADLSTTKRWKNNFPRLLKAIVAA